jgi:hypothetical protein
MHIGTSDVTQSCYLNATKPSDYLNTACKPVEIED